MKYRQLVKRLDVEKDEILNDKDSIWDIVEFLSKNKIFFKSDVYMNKNESHIEGSIPFKKCLISEIDKSENKILLTLYSTNNSSVKYWCSIFDIDNVETILDICADVDLRICNFIDKNIVSEIIF